MTKHLSWEVCENPIGKMQDSLLVISILIDLLFYQ